jgi:hypothetical protein
MHILCKEVSSDCKIVEVSIVRGGVGEIGSLVVKKKDGAWDGFGHASETRMEV